MANKKKTKKRLSRRMRKTIRITSAVILLLSAIGVALIPQSKKTSAADQPRVTVKDEDSSIPVITASDKIYTTGDGMFQFAYVNKGSGGDKVAVIVGYDYERSLDGGQLTIPDSFDAYVKYTHAQGTTAGYAAVGKSENVLYYPIYVDRETGRTDPETGELIVDENGNPETERVIDSYRPCLYSDIDEWYYDSEKGGAKRDVKDFYYTTNGTDYQPTTDEAYQWIHEATVAYISSQHVVKSADETTWELDPTPNTGIFSQASNIKNLSVGRNLLGIGNYAFYNCASLQGITLADGINTIGNSAFANCVNLKAVDIPANSAITAIGDHAFYNNRSLESFTVPVAVRKIGDSAFENCAAIKDIDMSAGGQNVLLDTLGDDVFKGCTTLESLSFPDTFNQDIEAGWLEGDSSLKYVKIPNAIMNVVPSADFGLDDLLAQLPEEFYFEGPDSSNIHTTSRDNSFSFKYLDQEIYEKVIDNNGKLVYQVDNNNELIYFSMEPTVSEVDIPDAIGPYHVTKIGTGSFTDNPNLTKITIPSSITEIEGNAFKGCYNLKDVIFEEPINLSYIGDGAFDTQVVDSSVTLPATPELTFTGVAEKGSAPFDYAMDPNHKINRGSQQTTYIKFYTGWPSNLTVQYNPEDNAAELIDYPHLEELAGYTADDYPYITPEMAAAASSAKAAYDSGASLTEDQRNIINSALNIDIPNGVETIKDGIFSGKDEAGNVIGSPNTDIKTITTENLKKIEPYAFAGCTELIGAYVNGDTTSIGDFAFQDDEKLADVDITSSLQSLGTAPFASCTSLSDVDFKGSSNFVCSDAAIYEYDANKKKSTLIEVLKAKGLTYGSGAMNSAELGEVSNIYPYAFYDCDGVISADL
nr:leucine-rich repeat domain-containing protein [Lachnospiraceae bacterium]